MTQKKTVFLVVVLLLLSLVSTVFIYGTVVVGGVPEAFGQTSATDWWPMFRHDLSHSGSSNSAAPTTNQTLWKFNTGGQVGSPDVVDGVVYVGSYDQSLRFQGC